MAHYFSKKADVKSNQKQVTFCIDTVELTLITDHGLFNKGHLDQGTASLLQVIDVKPEHRVLDLGCGSGIIGLYCLKRFNCQVDMVDINERAVKIATENLALIKEKASVYQSDGFEQIDGLFDVIILNPPIHAGKAVIYQLFKDAYQHLDQSGSFYMVMHKKHGAKSAIAFLKEIYDCVTILRRDKGFYSVIAKKD
jgi:16S rRNA (guanine1207-N2)-methyltransferase